MKMVVSWSDLQPFGIAWAGEACGLRYRLLFDLTRTGRQVVGKCFGIENMTLGEPRNRGSAEDPHVGSILLTKEALVPLAVFALLEGGCKEVCLLERVVVGFEAGDPLDAPERVRRAYGIAFTRRFSYGGTAGDRNEHPMSGRVG